MLSGMAALNGGLGSTALSNGSAGPMDALTQAYSGIQQYAAAALPTLYSQSLLQQQSAAGSQKEGKAGACMHTHLYTNLKSSPEFVIASISDARWLIFYINTLVIPLISISEMIA